ncbi:hypothetical protein JIN85_11890 [Luteolibacter pohnpeiensis]|uniref:Uncharacterized protein n=1 Tax=Luteolibacter pohnpeiensis TaxID=454153 RepID=A0A934SBH5_9BACT|nr:hypothetical protein [Luteolibacter pohnpeiensis]MBK1883122.1 hypothetical protein [Luteolibacter pohnpeiensis]
MKSKTIKRIVLGLVALYPMSYLVASCEGFYEPVAFGLLQGRDGKAVMAPKACFGYHWIPFEGFYQVDGFDGVSLRGWSYYPLLSLDRVLWHQSEKWKNRPDLTKNYFDYEALEYRQGNKDQVNQPR